jgi:hypothetical protein
MAEKQQEPVTLKMSREDKAELDATAEKLGLSRSALLRRGWRAYRAARAAEERRANKKPAP